MECLAITKPEAHTRVFLLNMCRLFLYRIQRSFKVKAYLLVYWNLSLHVSTLFQFYLVAFFLTFSGFATVLLEFFIICKNLCLNHTFYFLKIYQSVHFLCSITSLFKKDKENTGSSLNISWPPQHSFWSFDNIEDSTNQDSHISRNFFSLNFL